MTIRQRADVVNGAGSSRPCVWKSFVIVELDLVPDHVQFMYMKNVQITIDQATLLAVDRAAAPLGLKRSEVVRQALREWLRRRSVERFEQEWIAALRKSPDDAARADDWLLSQAWSER
jgi:hypothetical protein